MLLQLARIRLGSLPAANERQLAPRYLRGAGVPTQLRPPQDSARRTTERVAPGEPGDRSTFGVRRVGTGAKIQPTDKDSDSTGTADSDDADVPS